MLSARLGLLGNACEFIVAAVLTSLFVMPPIISYSVARLSHSLPFNWLGRSLRNASPSFGCVLSSANMKLT